MKEYVNNCMYYLDDYCTTDESYFLRNAPYEDFSEEIYNKIKSIIAFYTYTYPGTAKGFWGTYIHEYMMEKFPTNLTGDKKIIYIYSYMHHTKEERTELAQLLKTHKPEDHRRINELLSKLIETVHNTGLGSENNIRLAVNSTLMYLAQLERENEIDFERMHTDLEKIEDALIEKDIYLSFFEIMHEQLTMYQQLLERM